MAILSSWLHCRYYLCDGCWESATAEMGRTPSRKHCPLHPGDTPRRVLHNSSRAYQVQGKKKTCKEGFPMLVINAIEDLTVVGERDFWFAADQFPQVDFTVFLCSATGLWRATGSRTEEMPVRWRRLAAQNVLHLGVNRPCASGLPLLPYFSYSWKCGFPLRHFPVRPCSTGSRCGLWDGTS